MQLGFCEVKPGQSQLQEGSQSCPQFEVLAIEKELSVLVRLRELRSEAGYGDVCDRYFQSFLQRANFNFLCNMQGNWSFSGHNCFVQTRNHSPGVLSA